jgi:hypothetical protein
MNKSMIQVLGFALFATSACSQHSEIPQPAPAEPAPAPWQGAPLAGGSVAPVYLQEWNQAQNKSTCAPIAFTNVGAAGAGATPRAATFSGGWGVAYDLPDLRSAFGVAGAGVSAAEPSYDDWPHRMVWADGSSAGYGPEGGTGPNQLAYLRIAGQGCLYNVWSRLGIPHLETLLQSIRMVEAPVP